MSIGKILIWIIVGAFAGTLAGRLVTMSKTGYGPWVNFAIGILGAIVGGTLFWLLGINLGLEELKFTVEDLVSAFVGSLICIFGWWFYEKNSAKLGGGKGNSELKL
jgi:uncharacterized membrane protein YeaQ/YmgE (transglycosylase-associated protein family)